MNTNQLVISQTNSTSNLAPRTIMMMTIAFRFTLLLGAAVGAAAASGEASCSSSFSPPSRTQTSNVPPILLSNGVEMPSVAAGTCFRDTSKTDNNPSGIESNPQFFGFLPEKTYRSLTLALEMGYTHIDTALVYRSQKQIGTVLAAQFMSGKLRREDVFITSKLFHGEMPGLTRRGSTLPLDDMTPEEVGDAVEAQFELILEELGVGYVDVMLLHWPAVMDSRSPGNSARRLAAWTVLEDMYERGQARAIGVSNFSEHHLEQLMNDGARIQPHINQIEASVYKQWDDIKAYCDSKGIALMAYSPLGLGKESLLTNPVVKSIAEAKGVATSQVALRYLIQKGYAVLPMSSSEERLRLNLDLFGFELSEEGMRKLEPLAKAKDEGIGLPSPYDMS
jgi:diketogulonate reductase-like aldo/keto reductase